jgi:hypothetical protein
LVLGSSGGKTQIVSIKSEGGNKLPDNGEGTHKAIIMQTIEMEESQGKSKSLLPFLAISASVDGKWFLTARNSADGDGQISFFFRDAVDTPLHRRWWTLPAFEVPLSAVSFLAQGTRADSSQTQLLAVAGINHAIYVFDVDGRRPSPWSEEAEYPLSNKLPPEMRHRNYYSLRFANNPASPSHLLLVRNALMLQRRETICVHFECTKVCSSFYSHFVLFSLSKS